MTMHLLNNLLIVYMQYHHLAYTYNMLTENAIIRQSSYAVF